MKGVDSGSSDTRLMDQKQVCRCQSILCAMKTLRANGEQTSLPSSGELHGDWKNDQRNGKGVIIYASTSERYEGEFQNDKKKGKGIYNFSCGERYEGNFKDNLKQGYGNLEYENGARYNGQWGDDKCNGKGKMIDYNKEIDDADPWIIALAKEESEKPSLFSEQHIVVSTEKPT